MDVRDILISVIGGIWYFRCTDFSNSLEKLIASVIFGLLVFILIVEIDKHWNAWMHRRTRHGR